MIRADSKGTKLSPSIPFQNSDGEELLFGLCKDYAFLKFKPLDFWGFGKHGMEVREREREREE